MAEKSRLPKTISTPSNVMTAEPKLSRTAYMAIAAMLSTYRRKIGHDEIDGVIGGYRVALSGVASDLVQEACARWLRGQVLEINGHATDFSFPPTPPQLAIACRRIEAERQAVPIGGPTYGWTAPCSEILHGCITAAEAKRCVDEGDYPRGSIWCPGSLTSTAQDVGMLYAPDPRWRAPVKDGSDAA